MSRSIKQKNKRGFTLIEIMIVVLIIGLLAAIAVPNWLKSTRSAQAKSCIANLRQIEAAKLRWQVETKAAPTAVPGPTDLYGPDRYIKSTPTCPAGGTYHINDVSTKPTCSIPGHELP